RFSADDDRSGVMSACGVVGLATTPRLLLSSFYDRHAHCPTLIHVAKSAAGRDASFYPADFPSLYCPGAYTGALPHFSLSGHGLQRRYSGRLMHPVCQLVLGRLIINTGDSAVTEGAIGRIGVDDPDDRYLTVDDHATVE